MKKNFKRLTRNNLEKSILNYMSNGCFNSWIHKKGLAE